MAKNFILTESYTKVENLNKMDSTNGATLADRVIKLSEECGEVSQAYLKSCVLGSKSAEHSSILEECCDVINVALDIIAELKTTDEEAKEMFERKLNKWESKASTIKEYV